MSAPLLPDRTTPLTQAQFSETYGSSLICCMISLPIYGISLLQVYMYYINYPRDSRWIKTMVALLVIFQSVHTGLTCNTVYHYTVLSYSKPLSLIDGEWSIYTANALGIPIVFLIQIYFARMVYLLAKIRWKLAVIITFSVLVAAQIAFGIYVSVEMFIIWDPANLKSIVDTGLVPLYCIRVVSDAITAVVLCVVLYEASSRLAIFTGSKRLFKTLMVYAMNRFILTTVVVVIQTIVLLVKPGSIWAMVLDVVTVHLYVNSLLATLNARHQLRTMGPQSNIAIEESTPNLFSGSRYISTEPNRAESNVKPAQINLFRGKKQGDVVDPDGEQYTYKMAELGEAHIKPHTSSDST